MSDSDALQSYRRFAGRLLLLCTALLCGCGPLVQVDPEFEESPPQVLALLPLAAPESMRAERVQYLRTVLASEFRNAGYYLLDDAIVEQVCSSPECPERETLSDKYEVNAFVETIVNSNSRYNFLLGFYNELNAIVRVVTPWQKQIAEIEHTQSKRGGLVFQSGQVIEGIEEQYTNFGDDGYNLLADKFANTAVSSLPRSRDLENQPALKGLTEPQISAVMATAIQDGVYQLCLDGTPDAIASLVVRRLRANLREVEPGHYCGIFSSEIGIQPDERLEVELRSIFGSPVRQTVALSAAKAAEVAGMNPATEMNIR